MKSFNVSHSDGASVTYFEEILQVLSFPIKLGVENQILGEWKCKTFVHFLEIWGKPPSIASFDENWLKNLKNW